ncbi:hypothetical protein GGR88_002213 [Sphingomonas jejuensis]|uniref:Uncharacterized protein n=1 Tax=Sphingomonas jejuensis TaxID=904715 RepID=A0ABX0XN79_9SPHN|nr:hypothetical protein [Sphingomonas jejuensis]NJC34699.1 hypothetical protein [Sphingomonas jejuensis]
MMPRTIIGGLLGGLALYFVGFIFWGTPLAALAYKSLPEAQGAALQLAMAQTLTTGGTGTYVVPNPATNAGTTLYGQGPVATVHYNSGGFPVVDAGALAVTLVLALIAGLVIAFALAKVARRSAEPSLAFRVGALFAIAIPLYLRLGDAFSNHFGLGYFAYGFVADAIGFVACVAVISRFLRVAPAGRPID